MDTKIGLSIFNLQAVYGDVKAIEIAKKMGCDSVDFDLSSRSVIDKNTIYSKSEDEILSHFDEVRKKAEEVEIEIGQTHGRICIYGNDAEFDRAVIENARLDCMITKLLNCPMTVMHNIAYDAEPKWMHQKSFELFNTILQYAKQYDVIVATETFGRMGKRDCCDFFANITEYMKNYNRIVAVDDNSKYFKMCMDTGHTNTASRYNNNPTPADAIRIMGNNIVALHLHDNDTFTDQHKMPFTGAIDWNDVFDALDEIGFNGIYNMEMVLNKYGDELMFETGEFAVKVMKNYLKKRYN